MYTHNTGEKSKKQSCISVTLSNNYDGQTAPQSNELTTKETVRQLRELIQTETNTNPEEEREFKNPIYGMTDENGYETIPASNRELKLQRVDRNGQEEDSIDGPVYVACPLYAQTIP